MLFWRLLLGALLIATLVGLCVLDERAELPGKFLVPVALLLSVLATEEVLRLAQAGGMRPLGPPIYIANVLMVLGVWFPALYLHYSRNLSAIDMTMFDQVLISSRAPWALAIGLLLIFIGEIRRYDQPGGVLANIAVGLFAMVYVGVLLSFAVQIRLFWGIGALAIWILTVKMGDIGAYTIGRIFGTNKMSPRISPGKTVEGAVGAFLFSMLAAWAGFHWLLRLAPPSINVVQGLPHGWVVFGLLMGGAGMLGDLAESLLKRDVGCKDSSSWMPGFGGVLDILDSLLLTAPLAWLLWSLGIVGAATAG